MGRIKTALSKRVTNEVLSKHREEFTEDYEINKQKVLKYIDFPSKKIRNVVAGYVTRLVKKANKTD